jgi:hypothetical protein
MATQNAKHYKSIDDFTARHLLAWVRERFPEFSKSECGDIAVEMADQYETDPEYYASSGWLRCLNDTRSVETVRAAREYIDQDDSL